METWLSKVFCNGKPFDPKTKEFAYLHEFFLREIDFERVSISQNQILKDLHRTFPTIGYFNIGAPGYFALQMVLKMYSLYDDDSCGYVQGMNFTAGMMVFHASPSIAFCLFVKLLDDYSIRENYTHGMPGLLAKCS
jgi:hypothetical protein